MSDPWVVTWIPTATMQLRIPGRPIQYRREKKALDSQKSAVDFVMSLGENTRRSAELHMPGGQVAFIESIELMSKARVLHFD